ncbi:FtsX-like permease family protein [Yinghuangia soli]|uniref:FtsX-like permease family protein n=1 Tax=Yinghuangia soli TaxID=2908204 RepID=A0AA41U0I1_9ACTN|nr:FtsX-like permease family protein [Yinghuangia soli]MCF2526442.1 FtsX-like permease family protein [Yinghuangia soli]
MNLSGWRAALRIARREAWRAKGRSLLITLMVALPVFAATAADITFRSQQLDTGERLSRAIGKADALVWAGMDNGTPLVQAPEDGEKYTVRENVMPSGPGVSVDMGNGVTVTRSPAGPPPTPPDVRGSIPPGAQVLTIADASVSIRSKHGLAGAGFIEFDYAAALAEGMVTQTRGRAPKTLDEIALTEKMMSISGLRIGDTTTEFVTGKTFTIVGAVEVPDTLRARYIYALPGALLDNLRQKAPGTLVRTRFLVDAEPGAYRWDQVRKLNDKGIVATSREAVYQDLPDSEVPYRSVDFEEERFSEIAIAIGVVVIGMALLEIVLLAGPAFAVGARRRRRDFGLVGVVGGDHRHIRTIVLADGVVLGLLAGITGTAAGLAASWFTRDWFADMTGKRLGTYDVRPLELLGVAALGLVIGVVAAAVPAFLAARDSVVDSLTGRRGVRHGSKILPVAGLALAALGLGLAYYGSNVTPDNWVLLGGCVLAQLGVIACCPALLGLAGRLGRFLPLTPRIALRDAARNRPRTAPAVAAIMAAIAGATAVVAFWAGTDHDKRAEYLAYTRPGQVAAMGGGDAITDVERRTKAIEETLPVTGPGVVDGYPSGCSGPPGTVCVGVSLEVPEQNRCPLYSRMSLDGPPPQPTPEQLAAASNDPRCAVSGKNQIYRAELPVGDAELAKRYNGMDDSRIAEGLKNGVVVFDKSLIADGKATVTVRTMTMYDTSLGPPPESERRPQERTVLLPAVYVEPNGTTFARAIIGREAARVIGIEPKPVQLLYDTSRMPTEAEEQRAREALSALGGGYLEVERGYQGRPGAQTLLLAAATIVTALGAAGVATGLALADGRRDLATLGAVGAPPYVRRTLSAGQSWVIALIGTGLGVVVGLLPAAALRWQARTIAEEDAERFRQMGALEDFGIDVPVIIPWAEMGIALVVIPLLAATVAAVFTRSRDGLRPRSG